jgi:hypothetical protein
VICPLIEPTRSSVGCAIYLLSATCSGCTVLYWTVTVTVRTEYMHVDPFVNLDFVFHLERLADGCMFHSFGAMR